MPSAGLSSPLFPGIVPLVRSLMILAFCFPTPFVASCASRREEPVDPPAVLKKDASTRPIQAVEAPLPERSTSPEPTEPGKITSLDLSKLFELQESRKTLVYDVRPTVIHAFGAIPGAISWPKSAFDAEIREREPEIRAAKKSGKVLIVYCTDSQCPDGRHVAERLAERGHDVSVFTGGYAEWKEAGF